MRVADQVKVIGEPLTEAKRACAVRQDLPGLRDQLDAAVADFLILRNTGRLRKGTLTLRRHSSGTPGASDGLPERPRLSCCWACSSGGLSRCAPKVGDLTGAPGRKLPGERAAIQFPARVISRACGLMALALGFTVLLGWAFDVIALKTVLPGLFAMQPGHARHRARRRALLGHRSRRIAAAISIAGRRGLDHRSAHAVATRDRGRLRHRSMVLPGSSGNQPGHPHPGRVAEVTSIAFVLLGAMLLLARVERAWARGFLHHRHRRVAPDGRAATGYLIGAGVLQSAAFFTLSPCTRRSVSSSFSWARWRLRPDTGWMALLSGDMPGATSARMLLPVAVAGPVLLAWLFTSGKQAGLYGPDFQVGLITLATIALLANALLWNAARSIACIAPDWPRRRRCAKARSGTGRLSRHNPDPICQFRRTRRSPSSTGRMPNSMVQNRKS